MARLKNRQIFVPGGFTFIQPETGWTAPRNASFQVVVTGLMAHRAANPALAAKHNWALDRTGVENDVDMFNANKCAAMGWTQFISSAAGEPPPPKSRPPSQQEVSQVHAAGARVSKIWAGVKTLNEWLDSGEPPVEQPLAEARAAVCAKCPQNGTGDFTKWFTMPASEAIRRQLGKMSERKLTTESNAQIEVCNICLCPMKVKVFTPLKFIKNHLTDAVDGELRKVEGCWITKELDA